MVFLCFLWAINMQEGYSDRWTLSPSTHGRTRHVWCSYDYYGQLRCRGGGDILTGELSVLVHMDERDMYGVLMIIMSN